MRILVAGGTGMLGVPVVQELVRSGHVVRVLTRRPDAARAAFGTSAEIIVGDITASDTLVPALHGCEGLHISLRGANDWRDYERVEREGLTLLLAAAQRAGVRKATYLSGAGLTQGFENLPPVAIKLAAEEILRRAGLDFTIFRATHFMESLDLFIRGRSATILGRQPHRYHYLAAVDFARLVARALDSSASDGKTLYAFGPEPFTMQEALWRYLYVVYPGMRISRLPLPMARIISTVTANKALKFASTLFDAFRVIGESGDPQECDRLLGKPSTTLSDWIETRAHRARNA